MANRHQVFRIALHRFGPFDSSLQKQWASFKQRHQSGLKLEEVLFESHLLQQALFVGRSLQP